MQKEDFACQNEDFADRARLHRPYPDLLHLTLRPPATSIPAPSTHAAEPSDCEAPPPTSAVKPDTTMSSIPGDAAGPLPAVAAGSRSPGDPGGGTDGGARQKTPRRRSRDGRIRPELTSNGDGDVPVMIKEGRSRRQKAWGVCIVAVVLLVVLCVTLGVELGGSGNEGGERCACPSTCVVCARARALCAAGCGVNHKGPPVLLLARGRSGHLVVRPGP